MRAYAKSGLWKRLEGRRTSCFLNATLRSAYVSHEFANTGSGGFGVNFSEASAWSTAPPNVTHSPAIKDVRFSEQRPMRFRVGHLGP